VSTFLRDRRLSAVFAVTLAWLAAAAAATAAQSPNPVAPGVYSRAIPAALQNSHIRTVQGSLITPSRQCDYPTLDSGRRDLSSAPVEWQEISVNTDTCTATFDVGTPASADQDSLSGTDATGGTSTTGTTGGSPAMARARARHPVARAACCGYTDSAFSSTWYVDIKGIKVSGVRNWINWDTHGSCVSASGPGVATFAAADGWYVTQNKWEHGQSCSYAYSTSYYNTSNTSFCLGLTVSTDYQPNRVRGYGDATYEAYANPTQPTATCAPLFANWTYGRGGDGN
jgi:hypothetical protein